jgi:hypothetical protein
VCVSECAYCPCCLQCVPVFNYRRVDLLMRKYDVLQVCGCMLGVVVGAHLAAGHSVSQLRVEAANLVTMRRNTRVLATAVS